MAAFDDAVLTAMRAVVAAQDRLDAATDGRDVVDLAEAKAVATLVLRRRLVEAGWSAPSAAPRPAPVEEQRDTLPR